MNANNVGVIHGRIANDLVLGGTTTKYLFFSIAINRQVKHKTETDFFNCKAWGNTAELIAKFHSKGSWIGLVYEPRTEEYINKAGVKMKQTYFNVESFSFVGDKIVDDTPRPNKPQIEYGSDEEDDVLAPKSSEDNDMTLTDIEEDLPF